MNFDELRSSWDSEKSDDVRIPDDIKKLKMAQHPIDKLKRNMHFELYVQIVALILIGFFPSVFQLKSELYAIYYIIYAMAVVISTYYLYSFYHFYKKMHHYSASTKNGLLELYYELRLNMERYKSFAFLIQPFVIAFLILYEYSTSQASSLTLQLIDEQNLFKVIIVMAFLLAVIMFLIHWWVHYFYGKYTKQIRQILNDLEEEFE